MVTTGGNECHLTNRSLPPERAGVGSEVDDASGRMGIARPAPAAAARYHAATIVGAATAAHPHLPAPVAEADESPIVGSEAGVP